MADFGNTAAAVTAGYALEQWTVVEGGNPGITTFYTKLEKITRGANQGEDDDIFEGQGSSVISQALADTAAVASLNANRSERYGFQEAGSLDMTPDGAAEVADAT